MEGWSNKDCWLWNKKHGIDAEASQSLKGNQITKEQIKDENGI